MSFRVLNAALLLLLLLGLGLGWAGARDFSRPNYEFLPDMARSEAYAAFEANPSFADGATLRPLPPGTIVRGRPPLPFDATPAGAERAGRELSSPLSAADPAVEERGAAVFAAFCRHCHGPGGEGDGPVPRRGFPPPASLLAGHAREMSDGAMFHALTFGLGNMPSHAAQLAPDDRWAAIAHVRRLQEEAPPAAEGGSGGAGQQEER
ncbi:MAG: cytochrome c [Planctomycetota bacterium]